MATSTAVGVKPASHARVLHACGIRLAVDVAMMIPAALVHQDVANSRARRDHVARDLAGVADRGAAVTLPLVLLEREHAGNLRRLDHLLGALRERVPLAKEFGRSHALKLARAIEGAEKIETAVESRPILLGKQEWHAAAFAHI